MLVAPKDILKNIAWRKALIQRCQADEEFREQVWIQCSRDFVFWCDLFVWTLSSKDNAAFPKVPFILYPFQELAARNLIAAVGREDRLIEKSRDMGATWLVIAVFVWFFVFKNDQSFLIGSRKQDYVDKEGDKKTLFYKVDFIIERLPGWMRPPIAKKVHRTNNHIENPLNGSSIDGESTNENFGSGDRRAAVLLDEFALVDQGYKILGAVGDVTNCCVYNSTPMGAAGAYYDTRQQMERETPNRILRFHWSEHPLKARGLYTSEDDGFGVFHPKILDASFDFSDYPFKLDGKLRSPAYDERERRAANKQIMAQQWDIDYLKSGYQFFDRTKLDQAILRYARKPVVCGELIRDPDWKSPRFLEQAGGLLQLWITLPASGKVPEEWNDFVIACDLAAGSGGEMSSNSCASICRRSTKQKVGEMTTNIINPTDFAIYCLAACKFFNGAILNWERNGPNGAQFGKAVKDSGYRNIFYQKKDARFDTVMSKEPGWWTTDDNKAALLGGYAEALFSGDFNNPSEEALIECGQYVQNGKKIEHSRSLANATEDPTAIGESHGDRVIADSLAFRSIQDRGQGTTQTTPESQIPQNCSLARRNHRQREHIASSW